MRAIEEALHDLPTADDRATLAREVSRAALMGARGNSGVTLSQIIRGRHRVARRERRLARAFRSASDAAYRAVKKPVEGTMLTAIRAMADAAKRGAGSRGDHRPAAMTASPHARDAPGPPGGGRGRRGGGRAGRDRPWHPRGAHRRGAGVRRRSTRRRSASKRSIRSLALSVLHGLRRRGRGARRRRSSNPKLEAARRLPARRWRTAALSKVHVHTDDPRPCTVAGDRPEVRSRVSRSPRPTARRPGSAEERRSSICRPTSTRRPAAVVAVVGRRGQPGAVRGKLRCRRHRGRRPHG